MRVKIFLDKQKLRKFTNRPSPKVLLKEYTSKRKMTPREYLRHKKGDEAYGIHVSN